MVVKSFKKNNKIIEKITRNSGIVQQDWAFINEIELTSHTTLTKSHGTSNMKGAIWIELNQETWHSNINCEE